MVVTIPAVTDRCDVLQLEVELPLSPSRRRRSGVVLATVLVAVGICDVLPGLTRPVEAAVTATPYPWGTPSATDVSGYALPSASALPGFTQDYATTFTGSSLPANWDAYQGAPGGDPGAMFSPSSVSVSANVLNLTATQNGALNPSAAGGNWITGGVCLCGTGGQLYGAYFYRSRVTGAGPTTVGLLWPDAKVWPPEIDFNETLSGATGRSVATVHFGAANHEILSALSINMTRWHTWGVVWTPRAIVYTVDGQVWGMDTNPASIPDVPMHLSIQQQTYCGAKPAHACPASSQSTQVDWVAQYRLDTSSPVLPGTSGEPAATTGAVTSHATWRVTSVGASMNAASTGVNFPSLSAGNAELYAGYGYLSASGSGGSSSGATLESIGTGRDLLAFDAAATGTVAPVGAQKVAGTSSTIAAMVSAGGVSSGVIVPAGALQRFSAVASSAALDVAPRHVGDLEVLAVRVASPLATVADVTSADAHWTRTAYLHDVLNRQDIELWLGSVTGTVASPIVVTTTVAGIMIQVAVQEFQYATPATSSTLPTTTLPRPPGPASPGLPPPASTATGGPPLHITPPGDGRPKLLAPRIDTSQVLVRWTEGGVRVKRLRAAVYTGSDCQRLVFTQTVPNVVDRIGDGLIHFSRARGGARRAGSFSPSRIYSARIIAALGPDGPSHPSPCLRVGRG